MSCGKFIEWQVNLQKEDRGSYFKTVQRFAFSRTEGQTCADNEHLILKLGLSDLVCHGSMWACLMGGLVRQA